ncbi:MAG TPA: hypothetical protein VFR31_13865 [Thermoanaerobaculia bacterium]|nr:hypothetical protein [Thermoanaerobaculia bacterium]
MSDIPDLDHTPYSEDLRRTIYDAVRLLQLPEHSEPVVFYAWGRWFAVWEDFGEDHRNLPLRRRWEVVRIQSDPSRPEGIMLHEV